MNKFWKTLLYILGFPVLLGLVVYSSITIYTEGITYGVWPFVGTILAVVFALIYTITFICTGHNAKKSGSRKVAVRGTAWLLVVAFIFTGGLWLVIDYEKILPDILDDATSGTVLFDDVREDFVDHAEIHGDLLDKFIEWNYANENLDNEQPLEYYLEQGYRNETVQELIKTNFQSIDKNGYASFKGPWIGLADGKRLTIPVLIHLVINERELDNDLVFMLNVEQIPNTLLTDKRTDKYEARIPREDSTQCVYWSILDMQGGSMDIDLGGSDGIGAILKLLQGMIPSLLGTVNDAIDEPALAGTPIYIGVNLQDDGAKLTLTSAVEARGMWDYKKSAWLNSNNLLFAVISIFPARKWLYLWGGMVLLTSLIVGAIRIKECGEDDEEYVKVKGYKRKRNSDSDENDSIKVDSYQRRYPHSKDDIVETEDVKDMTPYARTYYAASKARNRM